MINQEDLKFLVNLGKELRTQDNLGTRKPLIFKIMDTEIVECGEGNEDFKKLCLYTSDFQREEVSFMPHEVEKVKKFLEENHNYLEGDNVTNENIDESNDPCDEYALDELIEHCEYYAIEYKLRYFTKISTYSEEFLTRKAAKEHLAKYRYRYSPEAVIYCGCAVENEEVTRLTEIIERIYEENKDQ